MLPVGTRVKTHIAEPVPNHHRIYTNRTGVITAVYDDVDTVYCYQVRLDNHPLDGHTNAYFTKTELIPEHSVKIIMTRKGGRQDKEETT